VQQGLGHTLRLVGAEEPEVGQDVDVEIADPTASPEGDGTTVIYDDGTVMVAMDNRPLEETTDDTAKNQRWFRNLVDDVDGQLLSGVANDLLRGIEDDKTSRTDWMEACAEGIKLLGLTIETPGTQGSADGAPVEGMSRVRSPLLLEANLRFQANCRGEFLPVDGPLKIRDDSTDGSTVKRDLMANALQKDMNHYLTVTASEYYPDTDQMFFKLGLFGTTFKKIYYCPLRQRPVSERVDADDLIVNATATDLRNARRITHRVMMKPSTVKRLQILEVYRDIPLTAAQAPDTDAVKQAENTQQGVSPETLSLDDNDREIYECYCELDLPGFEHKLKGKATGLQVPYIVTIDVSTREILSIIRNYDKDDEMAEPRMNFVKYTFVPGLGFYDIGLLHIMGNLTNAATALTREMLDAGMFANFPGFLMADTGARQNTNIFRVPPGGGSLVKTNGMALKDAIMPLPYKEPGPAMVQLLTSIQEAAQRVGGTAELQVGEGRADAPVGTTLALIDQATKVLNSVHKRIHTAQAQEFELLFRCFREHPEALWKRNKRPTIAWDETQFVKALDDYDLVPQADPNTSSQTQRMMKVMGLNQLKAANPTLMDPIAVLTASLQAMGWSNPEQFMVPMSALGKEPPEVQKVKAELMIKKQDADTKRMQVEASIDKDMPQTDPLKEQELALKNKDVEIDALTRERERESRERLALVNLQKEVLKVDPSAGLGLVTPELLNTLGSNEEPIGG